MTSSPDPDFHGFPVAPGRWPVLGHYPAINRDPWRFFHSGVAAHGAFFWIDQGFGSWTLVAHGEAAFEDLVMNTDHQRSQRSLAREHVRLLGRRVMSALDGAEHRRMRRPIMSALSRLEPLAPMVQGIAARSVEEFLARGEGKLSEVTRVFTMSVVLGLLGIPTHHAPAWQRVYRRFTLGFVPLDSELWGTPRWLALRAKRWIDARLRDQITMARTSSSSSRLLHTLVAQQHDADRGLDDEELLDNLRNLITAGVHPSAQTLTWMLCYLATTPALWSELAEEVCGVEPLPRSVAELARFPLLTGLLRETMRLRPVLLGLSRVAGEGLTVAGRSIPPGIKLMVPMPSLLTSSARYDDPMRFDPHRWVALGRPCARLDTAGFGGGPHYCAGHLLTWLEASTFVATLIRAATRRGLRLHMDAMPRTRVLGPAIEAVASRTHARIVSA